MRKLYFSISGVMIAVVIAIVISFNLPKFSVPSSYTPQDVSVGRYENVDVLTIINYPKIKFLITRENINEYNLKLKKNTNPFYWEHAKVIENETKQEEVKEDKKENKLLSLYIEQTPISPLRKGTYRITSPFGVRVINELFNSEPHLHRGIDLGCPIGTEVYAPLDGEVIEAFYNTGGGNVLIIDHGNKIKTVYAHLDSFKVKKGDKVRQGDLIALSGNTGEYTTGPHLHFELWFDNTPIDPSLYIDF